MTIWSVLLTTLAGNLLEPAVHIQVLKVRPCVRTGVLLPAVVFEVDALIIDQVLDVVFLIGHYFV